MNWGLFALAVSGLLAALWLWQSARRQWAWPGLYASFGCLLAACFNSAAPLRGAVDPGYMGYAFGLARADMGLAVTFIAGAIFLACAASAFIAARRRTGPILWIVAGTCAAMAAVVGLPTLIDAMRDPSANMIQFGEYLTIPGVVGSAVLLLLLTFPFLVGAIWGARAAMRPAA